MIGYGMVYATAIGLPILLAAMVCSTVIRRQGRAERGVWLAALGLALALPVMVLLGPSGEAPAASAPVVETGLIGLPTVIVVPEMPVVSVLPVAQSALGVDEVLVGLWLLASLSLLIRWVVAAVRLSRLASSWPTATVDGVRVWLTADLGPAVTGVVRPRILVPSWLASMPPAQRSLVLIHEEEHVRSKDPVLVVVSRIARILTPWNPFVWLLSSRLLRAVELDCDRRVLRRHPDVEAYGTTLLTVSSRHPGGLVGAAAFANSEAPLRKRILAMTTPPGTVSVIGVITALVLGILLLVGVFEVPIPAIRMQMDVEPPISGILVDEPSESQAEVPRARLANLEAEIQALDARQLEVERRAGEAEARVQELTEQVRREGEAQPAREPFESSGQPDVAQWGTISGVVTDGDSERPLKEVQVFVRGTGLGGLSNDQGRILLLRVPPGEYQVVADLMGFGQVTQAVTVVEGEASVSDFRLHEVAVPIEGVVVLGAPDDREIALSGSDSEDRKAPLIYIDGVRMDRPGGSIDSYLDGREQNIDRIEVIKPAAAIALYGEEASAGVIQIFLKQDSAEPAELVQASITGDPVFTPFSVAPSVLNIAEVREAMREAYPLELREQGIGGTVEVYFFINEQGSVLDFRIATSSEHQALDDAALAVASVYSFSPALNRDQAVPVWVSFPIIFLGVGAEIGPEA